MKASLLRAADVPAGQLTFWHPAPNSRRAAATAPVDSRPLSADQIAHLAQVPVAEPGTVDAAPWIGLSCYLKGATRTSIATTLSRYFDRHEVMRGVFTEDDDACYSRTLIDSGTIDFEPRTAGTFDVIENHRRLSRHLALEARCNQWPYAGFATITNEGGTTLFAAFDHVVFDGYSMYISMDEFPRLHEAVIADEASPEPASSHADFATEEQVLLGHLTPTSPELATWQRTLNEYRRLPGLPSSAGISSHEAWPHDFVSLPILSPAETDQVIDVLRTTGQSIGLGFLAATVQSAAAFEPEGEMTFLMSTHNRPNAHWAPSIGWFAGVAPISVRLGQQPTHADTLTALASQWQAAHAAGVLRMPEVAQRLRAVIEPGLVVSYMDGRRAPGSERWNENRARALLGPTPPNSQIHLWVSCMPDGTHLEVRFPTKPCCAVWIAKVASSLRDTLLTLSPLLQISP